MLKGIGFDGKTFAHAYVGRKFRRILQKFYDIIGRENFLYAMRNNKGLLDYIPEGQISAFGAGLPISRRDMSYFSDNEIYAWLPEEAKLLIEREENGKKWALAQIKSIKKIIT